MSRFFNLLLHHSRSILTQNNRLVFGLSLLGLAVSSYLAYEYSLLTPIGCPIGGASCETVRQSAYSHIFGIPIPHMGIAYYLTMAILSLLIIEQIRDKLVRRLQFLAALSAVIFSGYLTLLEALVIKAYCFWCVTSAIIATLIFVFVAASFKTKR